MSDLKVEDNCLGYYEEEKFVEVCNFYFEPLWQIQTGKKSGYVADVYTRVDSNPRLVRKVLHISRFGALF